MQLLHVYTSGSMYISELPNEILLNIFRSLASIHDCLALAATDRHFRSLLASSHRLPILYNAAEAQYGPLGDVIRLVTHNASQAPHIPRATPPQSLALLRQIIEVGRVANKWATLYPSRKWRGSECASRRLLSSTEQYRLRRACYRSWLYTLAFHTPAQPRTTRLTPQVVRNRAALLRPWTTAHLAEILDLQDIFRHVLESSVCPSNSTVLRRHRERHPHDPFPLVAVTAPDKWAREHAMFLHQTHFHCTPHSSHLLPALKSNGHYGIAVEGWGDEISHYYVIEDMLKLDPGQLMYLYEHISEGLGQGAIYNPGWSSKGLVESFVIGLGGEWFENNGETLAETVKFVIGERGGDSDELRLAIDECVVGLVSSM